MLGGYALQSEIEDITTQIAAAYERRDKLWADLERDLGECGIFLFSSLRL